MTRKIFINEYDYPLNGEKIAKFPLPDRDRSRLLVYDCNGSIRESIFSDISGYLPQGSLLIFNNTRVIHARLKFVKSTGAEIEVFCLQPVHPSDYALAFQQRKKSVWLCLVGNLKRWKQEIISKEISSGDHPVLFTAKKMKQDKGSVEIEFSWDDESLTFGQVLLLAGDIPIPPYLSRKAEESDKSSYQTVYSKIEGSVAAPTAGLHFTEKVLTSLKSKKIETGEVTLHVGAGTFQPVKEDDAVNHPMHAEIFFADRMVIEKLIRNENVIAVGTTSVRTLESLYWCGMQIIHGHAEENGILNVDQWEWTKYREDIPVNQSLSAILRYMNEQKTDRIAASTRIMIIPGYRFRVVKGLITNFHQPKSTLLLLVSAFVGDDWKKIYDYALKNNFRFLSYGDSSLILGNNFSRI